MPELPTVVVAVVTSPRGVLVGRRCDGNPPWTFPGGAQEPGETHFDTAVRECMEETGLPIVAGEVIGARDHPKTGRHMVYVACQPVNGTDVVVGDPEELVEVAWRSPEDLDELMPFGVFEPVAEHLWRVLS